MANIKDNYLVFISKENTKFIGIKEEYILSITKQDDSSKYKGKLNKATLDCEMKKSRKFIDFELLEEYYKIAKMQIYVYQ